MKHSRSLRLLMLALIAVFGVGLAACSDDATVDSGADSGQEAAGNPTDRAFAAEMIEHHEAAVEMARIAKAKGQHAKISQLADDIIATQNAEIRTLTRLGKQLDAAGVEAGDLGMAEDMMGMSADMSMLEDAKAFDRAFIDMMVAHHQGAIRMARLQLAQGSNPRLKELAEAVVDAQSREIEQMNDWRTAWYGGPSPAGGVPGPEDTGGSEDPGGHSGGH